MGNKGTKGLKWTTLTLTLAAGVWTGTHWTTLANSLGGDASAAASTGAAGSSAAVVPGTAEDPVVTKSYVDQRLAELGFGTGGSGGSTPTATPTPTPTPTATPTATTTPKPTAKPSGGGSDGGSEDDGGIKVINVPVGKTLIAADGAEVVVRAGKAVAYSPDSNGIADVTDGIDIKSGAAVPQNHLILFPRGGRGVSSAPGMKTGLTVMVKGSYEIKMQP
ncbi:MULTISPECIES: hypothetical protein [unclassified Paenibacillus]|uniref:hypothetical protein n=1 Tax=unclassified Paenibacillus TaxID=185978 RepID=UPI0009542346|nr:MULTISPECIES: hypothetical protein [unclassified Paenibacillus]SIQ84147.1 hypothetical protein SAMN05880555_2487 [Paenibacillus sp. RU4X]SIR05032.1 hypothetical protein SAMN05880570_2486 [Paenibacillus sp. RU4T]